MEFARGDTHAARRGLPKVIALQLCDAIAEAVPQHLPRECVVVPDPTSCACCGGSCLMKLGDALTETLEVAPRTWKVIQHVREKLEPNPVRERLQSLWCLQHVTHEELVALVGEIGRRGRFRAIGIEDIRGGRCPLH